MDQAAFEATLMRKASKRHAETVGEISALLQQLVEPATRQSEMRAYPRFPICVRLQVTPCSEVFSALGPTQIAFSQNLSAGGAALLLAEQPEANHLRVEFANGKSPLILILRILWKRQSGKFVEAGGTFVARI
jgi:hypothetical protein